MRSATYVGATLALALVTGCAPAPTERSGPIGSQSVDVDTPRLRALKERAGVAPCVPQEAPAATAGPLPDTELPCLGGGSAVNLARLEGPAVVVAWAPWCPPCRDELPLLARFDRIHGHQVTMIGVDWSDPQPDAALRELRRAGATYPQLADPDNALRLRGIPAMLVVDAEGHTTLHAGGVQSVAELEDLVGHELGEAR